MAYILEIITINKKENLFWFKHLEQEGRWDLIKEHDSWYDEFKQSFIDRGYFVDNKIEITSDNIQNEHGHWLAIKRIGMFKEPPMATNFFRDLNESTVVHRNMARKWTQDNLLTVEVNVLDSSEEIAVKQSSCQAGICGRKDGSDSCPTGPLACHDTSTGFDPRKSDVKEFHIPLQSFIKFKTK